MEDVSIKERIGNRAFVDVRGDSYMIQMDWGTDSFSSFFNGSSADWDTNPVALGGENVVPWGAENNMPADIRDLLEKNNLGPGILDRKVGLIYGQGPVLYRNRLVENEIIQEWVDDPDVQRWLDSWDYRAYIRAALVEFVHMNGHFTLYRLSKGAKIGSPKVKELEVLHSTDCRMVWPEDESRSLDGVSAFLVGDFANYKSSTFRKYPKFNRFNIAKAGAQVGYHSLRSFGRQMYAVSSFIGSIPWLRNANDLPQIIHRLNENMIAAAYVVHSPQEYWEQKKYQMTTMHPEWEESKLQREMEKLRDEVTKTIADVMAGKNNAGKFFSCVDFVDQDGHAQSWRIEPIDMKIDEYINAQQKISRIADSSTTSGFGLSPALSNIIIDGKSDSGSQMLYALKIFYGADTQIPEEIVLEAINNAIAVNFPEKRGLRMGFYRRVINKEENVSSADRTVAQV